MGFLKISRRATFWKILIHVKEFWIELEIAEISPVTLLKSDSTTDALLADLTILRKLTENIWGGVSFQSSFGWQIRKLQLLKKYFF